MFLTAVFRREVKHEARGALPDARAQSALLPSRLSLASQKAQGLQVSVLREKSTRGRPEPAATTTTRTVRYARDVTYAVVEAKKKNEVVDGWCTDTTYCSLTAFIHNVSITTVPLVQQKQGP